jgi:hypothetical protein
MKACAAAAVGSVCLGAIAAWVGGCSSSNGAACNPCDPAGSQPVLTGHTANPDGVLYPAPATGYGKTARRGTNAGSIIQNFKFLGYPRADASKGLQTIALADYYDPCNKRLKLLHLTVAGVWCAPCNQETDAMVAATQQLASDRVMVIQALDDGPALGTPATQSDLDYWIRKHGSNFTEMLDPGLKNLGGFFDAASIPWNCDIDPRTMEIIRSANGWAGDVTTELSPALSALPMAPSYPLPVTCP